MPDDSGRFELRREISLHGLWATIPLFGNGPWGATGGMWTQVPPGAAEQTVSRYVPGGEFVFGFWPGRRDFFIGAEATPEGEHENRRTRKWVNPYGTVFPVVDKTWFFDAAGDVTAWMRARRLGDAADGKSMLFRATADSRIATLGPDRRVKAMRRFVWKSGATADAVTLWDELRLGLFIRDERVVLAKW